MKYQKLEYYISKPRINRFLKVNGHSKVKAQKLYKININVSQSFYPILHLFEIFLRNSVNEQIAVYFSDREWIINEKKGFMADSFLHRSRFYLKQSVIKAEKAIKRRGGTVTPGKVIAEQSLAFWTSLFQVHHFKLIGGVALKIFNDKPSHVNRKKISKMLNEIRKFRNRIYHNEPICFNGSKMSFSHARRIKSDIYNLLSWMDEDLTKYSKSFDTIDSKIKTVKSI